MIWKICWRNIWRNKKRSGIIVAATTFALWAGIIAVALSFGMMEQIVDSAIKSSLSHIQIHAPGFMEQKEIGRTIPGGTEVLRKTQSFPGVKAASGRSIVTGMASTAATASGVMIYGIDPVKERAVTDIWDKMQEGGYFQTSKRNPIVIGRKLADRLETKLGSKVVLTAQAQDSSISAGAFRVVGIYRSESAVFDEIAVFALQSDIDKTFGLSGQIHEIAAVIGNPTELDSVTAKLTAILPGLKVDSWKMLSKTLAYYVDAGVQMMDISMMLILLTLVFGITNTLLMGVVERVREIGVVMALGMNHFKVFSMVLIESLLLSLTGGALGMFTGVISIEILAKYGIDLSNFSEGLAEFGMSHMIYPILPLEQYPKIILMVIITAVIAAIFPGIKAMRLNPIKAIRSY